MSGADLVSLLAWAGVAVLAATIAAWARYAMLRTSTDEVTASLRLPVAATAVLVVVVLVLVVAEPSA